MAHVSFAIREDPNSIFLLQDGGKCYPQYCQVTSLFRNIIRPEFFRQYMYFAPYRGYNGKYKGAVNDLAMSIEDNGYVPKDDYVAMIDSEVEFRITPSVIRHLSREHLPAWGMKSYLDYLTDRKSGILLFLRVYKVNQSLDPNYFEKGMRGSSHILKLYDEYAEEASLYIDGLDPVISDNKFSYVKDEIIHILKVENALLSIYDDTEEGLNSLQERITAGKKVSGTQERWGARHLQWINGEDDEDGGFDAAQLDYEAIFDEVLELSPEMANIIEYVRGIRAARYGEYDYCLELMRGHTDKESEAITRLFEMSLRFAIKAALYYHKDHGIELEDAFQEACIGVMKAIQRYHENVEAQFPSYVSMWIRQSLWRYLPPMKCNVYIPDHRRNAVYKRIRQALGEMGEDDLSTANYGVFLRTLSQQTGYDQKKARRVFSFVVPAKSIEAMLDDPQEEALLTDREDVFDAVHRYVDTKHVREAMRKLSKREREVLQERFGFDGRCEKTLEEVGELYKITRERVRQIEERAKRKIILYYYRNHLITKTQLDFYLEMDENGKPKLKQGKRYTAPKKKRKENTHYK